MALRWVVLALVLANLLFFAWSRGWLGPVLGFSPAAERDPSRWSQQVQPELVRVLSPEAARSAMQAASGAAVAMPPLASSAPATAASATSAAASASQSAGVCLESAPIAASALDAAERALAVLLPERGWIRASRETAAQYGVVVGPLAGRDAVLRRRDELEKLRVSSEEVRLPGTPQGQWLLALGRFDTPEGAQVALDGFAKRGVRNARMVVLRAAETEWRLRLENVAPEKADQLRAASVPALGGAGFVSCAAPPR